MSSLSNTVAKAGASSSPTFFPLSFIVALLFCNLFINAYNLVHSSLDNSFSPVNPLSELSALTISSGVISSCSAIFFHPSSTEVIVCSPVRVLANSQNSFL